MAFRSRRKSAAAEAAIEASGRSSVGGLVSMVALEHGDDCAAKYIARSAPRWLNGERERNRAARILVDQRTAKTGTKKGLKRESNFSAVDGRNAGAVDLYHLALENHHEPVGNSRACLGLNVGGSTNYCANTIMPVSSSPPT